MPESKMPATKMASEEKIPINLSKELRTLAHDLSNSIECIMQACYLLNTSNLDPTSKKWAEMIDQGSRDAAQSSPPISCWSDPGSRCSAGNRPA